MVVHQLWLRCAFSSGWISTGTDVRFSVLYIILSVTKFGDSKPLRILMSFSLDFINVSTFWSSKYYKKETKHFTKLYLNTLTSQKSIQKKKMNNIKNFRFYWDCSSVRMDCFKEPTKTIWVRVWWYKVVRTLDDYISFREQFLLTFMH